MKPLCDNDFEGFRSPNNLSLLTMSLGSPFIMSGKFALTARSMPSGSQSEVQSAIEEEGSGKRPMKFSIFSRFAKEIKDKH